MRVKPHIRFQGGRWRVRLTYQDREADVLAAKYVMARNRRRGIEAWPIDAPEPMRAI